VFVVEEVFMMREDSLPALDEGKRSPRSIDTCLDNCFAAAIEVVATSVIVIDRSDIL